MLRYGLGLCRQQMGAVRLTPTQSLRSAGPYIGAPCPARRFVSNVSAQSEPSARLAKIVDEIAKITVLTPTQGADNLKQLEDISRNFMSDTITVPTKDMYTYATRASIGDDVYHEPSTAALENHIARLTGKEAALFLPSGTMSNQIALRTHLKQPPYSVICDVRSHIHRYEAGGTAFHSGAQSITIAPANEHHLTLEDIEPHIVSGDDVHIAPTRIIALENTLNGTIIPQHDVVTIADYAHRHNIAMHLDGARIWHVAAETCTPVKELCDPFDSVSLCLSKGLGAPVGTILVGSSPFIAKARWFRKLFGGGMRQTGVLAGAAAYALTQNFPLLPRVHALAKRLQQGLEELGVAILSPAETCMLFFDPAPIGVEYWEIVQRASQLSKPIKLGGSRLVAHVQTSPGAVQDFLELMKTLKEEKAREGWLFPQDGPKKNKSLYKDVYVRGVKPLT
ncbi:hypothetical protein SERLA73DRAFT_175157 [Serpula lacrymans var. lacrymans S7.3]|uniref:Aromatic amino acid beta-eliminating lyase/threonine aldolase domain-containing protein n=2 Tax=Serpula lacrymans var. lacrymans TaxID=341189 RepID=F8PKX2_SERL3|nr:uncharacterized protein SERLADRAFT_457285 [Serpula lacrymans var. lacrymans S7.9]EGO03616.1 hypothetical protein SERLA73DRAFT_175157 [Serpula lacrymans var. lacrymans S7.3]EGO29487.1 hypothetical protein SERLADRAFT_457285 [Serpula lacrymans var. lacrymans S7.9]